MVDHFTASSHGPRPEQDAKDQAQQSDREAPNINVNGGHVVFAFYGCGPVTIYRKDADEHPARLGSVS